MVRWRTPVLVSLAAILVGIGIGSSTNVINARVSALYFVNVMRWDNDWIWVYAPLQGALEGGAAGAAFGLVFAISIAASYRRYCPFGDAMAVLLRVLLLTVFCWAIGGLVGCALAAADPGSFRALTIGAPSNRTALLRYAWVGGSIWGGYAGAALSAIIAPIMIHRRSKLALALGFFVSVASDAGTEQIQISG